MLAVHAVITSNNSDNKKCKCSSDNSPPSKKAKIESQQLPQEQVVWPSFRFHSVDNNWQRTACAVLSLSFVSSNTVHPGGADVVLACPHLTQNIRGAW